MKNANFLSFIVWHLVFRFNIIFGYINRPGKADKISENDFLCHISPLTASLKSRNQKNAKNSKKFQNVLIFEKWQNHQLTREGSTLSYFV